MHFGPTIINFQKTDVHTYSAELDVAAIAGLGIGFNLVQDNYGKKELSFSFKVNTGVGVGYDAISSVDGNKTFTVSQWHGRGMTYDLGVGTVGISWGGDLSAGADGLDVYTEYGRNYTTGVALTDLNGKIKLRPKLKPKVSLSAMAKHSYTWNLFT